MKFKVLSPAITMMLACAFICTQAAATDNAAAKESHVISCVKPVWPQQALADKKTGTVTLALLIAVDGKVKRSKLTKSSGHPELDEAARIGIEQCIFKPGLLDGKPAEAWMMFQYVWIPD